MRTVQLRSGQNLINTHDPAHCKDQPCAIHHPSDHHMQDWTLTASMKHGYCTLYRVCVHGLWHMDPDDFVYHLERGNAPVIEESMKHGCECQCCSLDWPNTWFAR